MKLEKELIVKRPDGLHARPAGELVKRMKSFQSDVRIYYKESVIDAKSIIQLMKLSVKQGASLKVVIEGADAEQAIASFEEYLVEGYEN